MKDRSSTWFWLGVVAALCGVSLAAWREVGIKYVMRGRAEAESMPKVIAIPTNTYVASGAAMAGDIEIIEQMDAILSKMEVNLKMLGEALSDIERALNAEPVSNLVQAVVSVEAVCTNALANPTDNEWPRARWLDAPVTERWRQTDIGSWETVMPNIYSQRSPHDVEIGLREDGVVVWRFKEVKGDGGET